MRVLQTFTKGLGRAAFGLAAVVLSAGLAVGPVANVSAQSSNQDLAFDMEDIQFILDQIEIAEQHAAATDPLNPTCDPLREILPNLSAMLGLRTVDGSCNSLIPGQDNFGKADEPFPHSAIRDFRGDYALPGVPGRTPRHGWPAI